MFIFHFTVKITYFNFYPYTLEFSEVLKSRTSEMAPRVKVLAMKMTDLSLIPRTCLVEGKI